MSTVKLNIYNFSLSQLKDYFVAHNHPGYRATQVIKWLHQDFVTDFNNMTNISKQLRQDLIEQFITPELDCTTEQVSKDGTVKWLFRVDIKNQVETVFIPEKNRGTLCISSQAGCALACSFCATGMQGFSHNLSTAEIIGQLRYAKVRLAEIFPKQKITNVVMMGMGEPLLNLKNLIPALDLMLDDNAYGLSKYRVTVSTSGIVPAMEKLKEVSPAALAVSLHAPNDTLRDELVPINKKYNLKMLLKCCEKYFESQPKRKITIEYIMIDQVNDHTQHAKELAKLLKSINCKVNLIPCNPIKEVDYKPSTGAAIAKFRKILETHGYQTTVRKTRGDDIDAACGQLAGAIKNRIKQKKETE
jgi:23S rRNA (adenine2503-C2)-methyltransferase